MKRVMMKEEKVYTDKRETYQMMKKGTNRQDERKYDNYNQNESKLTEQLRARSIDK